MNRLFFLFFCCFLLGGNLLAQPDSVAYKSTEAVAFGVTDADWIDRLMPVVSGVAIDPNDNLVQQSVKPYMMPVRKIGAKGSALSYALATCLEFYVNLENNYKDNLSPDYISVNLENSGKPVNLEEACRFLAGEGTVSAAIMPYDAPSVPNAIYAAQKYQINNYLHLFRETTKGRQRVFETKKALMRGNPVLIELHASPELKKMVRVQTWKAPRDPDTVYPLLVVGYDEVDQVFEVMSSYGSTWGKSGYLQIRYDDFGEYAKNGYVLVPKPTY
jgi:hypothetical protein